MLVAPGFVSLKAKAKMWSRWLSRNDVQSPVLYVFINDFSRFLFGAVRIKRIDGK